MWVAEEIKVWLDRSLVGRVKNREDLVILKESFLLNGIGFIRLRYLGDNVVLLTGEEDVDLVKEVDENKEWLVSQPGSRRKMAIRREKMKQY